MASQDKRELIATLATSHGAQLRRFLRARVRNQADIPDIIQEVYLRLLRIPNAETIRAPEAYLFTVAQHVAQQHGLQQAGTPRAMDLDDMLSELRLASEIDPELEVSAQQSLEILDAALDQLSPKIQSTFLFYRRDGMSMEEVSTRLGISLPMAKKYLVKALVHFRKRLKESE